MSFTDDIKGQNTQLYPVVVIDGVYYSTNNVTFDGNYCKPILMNIPSIKESIDIESRKFKISNVTLDFNNFPFEGERFSDQLSETSLINKEAIIYFKSLSDSKELFRAFVRRISHDDERVRVELEDLTEKEVQKELPQEKQKDYFKSDFKYVPMVYGSVDKSPTLSASTQEDSFNIGSIAHSLLFDGGRNIGYKLGDDLRLKIDYRGIKGFNEYKVNDRGFYNPLFLYEDGKYHRVLESAQEILITDDAEVNPYQVFSQYSTPEGYIENYIDIESRFDSDSSDPSENNFKNLPSAGIVQCYKKQKFLQWNINIPYQSPSFDSPAQGFALSPSNPSGESNELSVSGNIETDLNLDFPFDNQVFNNCLIKFKIDEVPSVSGSKIFTYYNPRLSIGLSSTSAFQVVFNIYDSDGQLKNSGSGTLTGVQSSVGTYEYYIDEYNLDYEATDDRSFTISAFEWAVVDGYLTSGAVVDLTSIIKDFDIYNLYNLNFVNKDFYVDVNGRVNVLDDHPRYSVSGIALPSFIQNPIDIIYDILRSELGLSAEQINEDDYEEARLEHTNWEFAFTLNKKMNSKELIEDIAKSTKCFPTFRNDGTFGFNTIKDSYSTSDYDSAHLIKQSDVISYSFKKTKPEQIYNSVDVTYNKDYAENTYKSRTPFQASLELPFYGIENQSLEFESPYIRDEQTAENLRDFLSAHYKNDHLIFNLKLPLQYIDLEIGELVKFTELFQGLKAYGIDYRVIDGVGDTEFYPLFMITSITKNLDSVSIECMQLHHLSDEQRDSAWDNISFPDSEPFIVGPYLFAPDVVTTEFQETDDSIETNKLYVDFQSNIPRLTNPNDTFNFLDYDGSAGELSIFMLNEYIQIKNYTDSIIVKLAAFISSFGGFQGIQLAGLNETGGFTFFPDQMIEYEKLRKFSKPEGWQEGDPFPTLEITRVIPASQTVQSRNGKGIKITEIVENNELYFDNKYDLKDLLEMQ